MGESKSFTALSGRRSRQAGWFAQSLVAGCSAALRIIASKRTKFFELNYGQCVSRDLMAVRLRALKMPSVDEFIRLGLLPALCSLERKIQCGWHASPKQGIIARELAAHLHAL